MIDSLLNGVNKTKESPDFTATYRLRIGGAQPRDVELQEVNRWLNEDGMAKFRSAFAEIGLLLPDADVLVTAAFAPSLPESSSPASSDDTSVPQELIDILNGSNDTTTGPTTTPLSPTNNDVLNDSQPTKRSPSAARGPRLARNPPDRQDLMSLTVEVNESEALNGSAFRQALTSGLQTAYTQGYSWAFLR